MWRRARDACRSGVSKRQTGTRTRPVGVFIGEPHLALSRDQVHGTQGRSVHIVKYHGGQGGSARTGTDGHGRARPEQPTQTAHPHRPVPRNQKQVQSGQTRAERKAQAPSSANHQQSSIGATRPQGARASLLSHAQSSGAQCQGAGPPQTRAGSRTRGTAHAPHSTTPVPRGLERLRHPRNTNTTTYAYCVDRTRMPATLGSTGMERPGSTSIRSSRSPTTCSKAGGT